MGDVIPFRKRGRRLGRKSGTVARSPLVLTLLLAVVSGFLYFLDPRKSAQAHTSVHFALCGKGPRINCVVDGDTLWLQGHKIRVADINAPETFRPECAYEKALGTRAKYRFLALLNAGPFEIERYGHRDKDLYGRDLRVVMRDGRSLGTVLVTEGLARPWTGHRHSWCT